jgi:hypothetical protein
MSVEPPESRTPDPEEEIFEACLARPVEERAAYLDQVCAGDAALRQRIEELLRSHSLSKSFLEEPPVRAGTPHTIKLDLPLSEREGDRIGRYKLLQKIGEGGCGASKRWFLTGDGNTFVAFIARNSSVLFKLQRPYCGRHSRSDNAMDRGPNIAAERVRLPLGCILPAVAWQRPENP